MSQALIESGYFKGGPTTYYSRSNNTNAFGMGYNKRGFATSYLVSGTGEKWAIYPNFGQAVLDRFAWDKTRTKNKPNESINIDDYIKRCASNGYWVESGRDKGYTKLLYDILFNHGKTFDQLIAGNILILTASLLYLK